MTTTKTFHIGDILSVTTGCLVSPRMVAGVHELLDWMTGEALMTHQLPRASRECEDNLRAQHPDLAAITVPDWTTIRRDQAETIVFGWVAEQVDRFGETREVTPLPPEDHTPIDPITELKMMRPDAQIIGIVTGTDDE
jgi:hypothetical protein